MTSKPHSLYPFRFHRIDPESVVAVSESGDFAYLRQSELEALVNAPTDLPVRRRAELEGKFFIGPDCTSGITRLLTSRIAARKETILAGPSLHIIVPTLQCAHSCRYCQVSRSLDAEGFCLSPEQVDQACDTCFESPSRTLTIEFQGGDPLLRFDLVQRAIDRISLRNRQEKRNVRYVVASTLHQLTAAMCAYFKEHSVVLSTSIDGPASLHNANRPLPTRDAHERTVAGIELAHGVLGKGSVAALMTTTCESLQCPEAIVDEYVRLGLGEIFLRPLSHFGFAKRNRQRMAYSLEEFTRFYERCFARVLYWNDKGVSLREASAAIAFNKMLSPFDAGYVDLQSPSGAGLAVLVYNYDGFVYPSDEARMLAETGDTALRLGPVGTPLRTLLSTPLMRQLVETSLSRYTPGCDECAFNTYCGPDPVGAHAQFGTMSPPIAWTDHCRRSKWLFDFLFRRLLSGDENFRDLAHRWGNRQEVGLEEGACAK